MSRAQADKLKLQEELEVAKRALESSGNEKKALQGTLDLAQQYKLKLQGELKAADRLLESSRKENTELQGTLNLAQQSASVPDPAIGTGDVPVMMGRRCSSWKWGVKPRPN